MKDRIIEFYENRRCYANSELCGENRTRLSNGEYFPSPYPFIGDNYQAQPQITKQNIPRLFILSVNQNLDKVEKMSENQARHSLYPTDNKNMTGHMYGPLSLSVSISRIFYSYWLNSLDVLPNEEILNNIAYSNSVRCGNPFGVSGKPTETMILNCKAFTRKEIELFNPDFIFCIGRVPFWQIGSMYELKNIIQDFYYLINVEGKIIRVIYFYHYGIQQSVNASAKMITLFSQFNDNAKRLVDDIEDSVNQIDNLWNKGLDYSKFAKFYSLQIIKYAIQDSRMS